jgi:hypothetical protein
MNPLVHFFRASTELPAWLTWASLEAQSPTPKEGPGALAAIFRQATPLVVERLFRAENPADFEYVLDELLSDPAVAQAYWLMLDAMLAEPLPPPARSSGLHPDVPKLFGTLAAQHLQAGEEALFTQAEAFAQLLEQLPRAAQGQMVQTLRRQTVLDWFVTEADDPPLLIDLALKWTAGGLCGLALALGLMRHERLPDWLGLLLAERLVGGAHAYVQYVGSLPGIKLTRMLPPAERLDLERLWREHQEATWGLRLSMLQHRASNQAISAPFGELPDDD